SNSCVSSPPHPARLFNGASVTNLLHPNQLFNNTLWRTCVEAAYVTHSVYEASSHRYMENLDLLSVCANRLNPPVLLFLTEPCYAHVSFGTLAAFDVASEGHPDEEDRTEDAWDDEDDWEEDDSEDDWDDDEDEDEAYEEEIDDDLAYAEWDDEDDDAWRFGISRNPVAKTP